MEIIVEKRAEEHAQNTPTAACFEKSQVICKRLLTQSQSPIGGTLEEVFRLLTHCADAE
jgi:hypothetical protein